MYNQAQVAWMREVNFNLNMWLEGDNIVISGAEHKLLIPLESSSEDFRKATNRVIAKLGGPAICWNCNEPNPSNDEGDKALAYIPFLGVSMCRGCKWKYQQTYLRVKHYIRTTPKQLEKWMDKNCASLTKKVGKTTFTLMEMFDVDTTT